MSSIKKNTIASERLYTEYISDVSTEHLHRYAISTSIIKEKVVLDIASGEGYGSYLLSKYAKKVIGVDIDSKSIANAKIKYTKDNLEYIKGSTSDIPVLDNSIDVVISFETIEHHNEHSEMMLEIKRVLKPEGVLLISSPDKQNYSDKTGHENEYHVKELYKDEFIELISNHFKNYSMSYQKFISASIIINESQEDLISFQGDFENICEYNFTKNAMYLLCLASDNELPKIGSSIFNSNIDYNELMDNKIKSVQESWSFKLGNFLLTPFSFIKNALSSK